MEETREGRGRTVDVRRYVERIEVSPATGGRWAAEFTVAVTPTGTARPETVLRALAQAVGVELVASETFRTGIVLGGE